MKLGVIGGSGLYQIDGFEDVAEMAIDTPFGQPSDVFHCGILEGIEVVFLPRHGRGHKLLPGELNHRANIFGMKKLGVTHILSVSAVGSLREELRPRDVVVVDQYFDRTRRSGEHTFFGNGIVAHISMADPVCPALAELVSNTAADVIDKSDQPGRRVHCGGTYVNMEGPAFSTRAESLAYRSWNMDVIGMTNLAEAKLAREAEMHYCTAAMVTDYDCWHPGHEDVTVDMVIGHLNANAELGREVIKGVAAGLKNIAGTQCACESALACAIITNPALVSRESKLKLAPIIGKYLPVD